MSRRRAGWPRLAVLGSLALLAGIFPARAFRIDPGAREISPEERAIQADPDGGVQHGVILLEEAERDDPVSGQTKTSYHMRAKILSSEARSLGDIQIPFEAKRGWLRKWWAWTIQPDGTVLELERGDLEEITVVESRGVEATVLRGVLPGIVPGSVIDFGYVIQDRRWSFSTRIPLQREWPIQHIRYRWLPSAGVMAQYFVRTTPAIQVESVAGRRKIQAPEPGREAQVRIVREKRAVLVEGWNLPRYVSEPHMPPADLVRSSILLYYVFPWAGDISSPESFWSDFARRRREKAGEFLDAGEEMKRLLASMDLPAGAPLADRLRDVQDWITSNITNRWDRTAEVREAAAGEDDPAEHEFRASQVLEEREGNSEEIDLLFLGFARLLGADARQLYAPSRISGLWDKQILSAGQLSKRAIALLLKEGEATRIITTDPCSGLRFGQIPWDMAPSRGMLVTEDGPVDVVLPASDPRQNVLHSQARIFWSEDGLALVSWTSVGGGQRHEREDDMMRLSEPHQRQERLEDLCGAGPGLEITSAEFPSWRDPSADFEIRCEGTLLEANAGEFEDEVRLWPGGEWYPDPPSFPSEDRVHPVVFRHPFIDMTVVEVEVPGGFSTVSPPAPVKLGTDFASYALSITHAGDGYRVQRAFAIVKTTIPLERYGELREFLQAVEKADRTRIVFTRDKEAGS